MRAHYLQHVAFEGLGNIHPWLVNAGYDITYTHLFNDPTFPDPKTIDFLIIMGGPMSVKDETDYTWLIAEKQFIREVIDLGIPVLGICLGAQLIANVLGASIYKTSLKEIGWFPIQGIKQQSEKHFNFPKSTPVFHWHGETFDLPETATQLAKSDACENQAFQYGNSVIGLQFHLETTPQSAIDIVSHCQHELIPSPYIQNEQQILSAKNDNYQTINQLLNRVLSFLQQSRN